MSIGYLLAYGGLLGFIVYFFYKNGVAPAYLLFIVYAFPIMELKVIPFDYGDFRVFDLVTLIFFFFHPLSLVRYYHRITLAGILVALLIVTLILSSIASSHVSRALLSVIKVITPFIFAVALITEVSKDTNFAIRFVRGLRFACIVGLLFLLIQTIKGPEGFTFYGMLNQNVSGDSKIRYPGFFMDAQINGVFFALASFLWLINFRNPDKIPPAQLVLFALSIFGLYLSGSRSPMIGLAGGVTILIILLRGNLRFNIVRIAFFGGLIILTASVTTDTFKRFDQMDQSLDFRENIWDGALKIFKEQPSLGIGMNNYKDYVMKHAQDQSIMLDDNEILYLDHPENGYLKLLVEWGAIAFGLFVLILLRPLAEYAQYYFKGYDVRIATVFLAIVACWSISNISVFTLSDSRIIILLTSSLVFVFLFTTKIINFESAE